MMYGNMTADEAYERDQPEVDPGFDGLADAARRVVNDDLDDWLDDLDEEEW